MQDINQLEEKFLEAKKAYYAGTPIMSDFEFDELEEELKEAGSHLVEMVDGDESEGVRCKHKNPMLSLEKIQVLDTDNLPIDDIQKFFNRHKSSHLIEGTPKFDGSAMSLIYNDGKLEQGLTRGNELGGLDRTGKMKKMVPTKINIMGIVEIRGEIVIATETFNKKYLGEFANPRNFVAGKIAKDDLDDEILKDLDFVAYHILLDADSTKHFPKENSIKLLNELGFNKKHHFLTKHFHLDAKKEFENVFKSFTHYREKESPYQLDGFVLKYHESDRLHLGENNHHPKWAMAIKFPPKEAKTKIIDILWQPGSTGKFTPVAIFNPTELDGTMVSRATLHNIGNIVKNKSFIGAEVLIAKKGDIIPQVIKIVTPSSTGLYHAPLECPVCSSKLEIVNGLKEDTKHLMCLNEDCDLKNTKKFEAGVRILKVEECGGPTIDKFIKSGVRNVIDLFDKSKFNKANLIASGEFKEGRQLEIKLNSVAKIKSLKLEEVIDSLKLKDAGTSISREVAKYLSGIPYDFKGLNKTAIEKLTSLNSNEYKKIQEFLAMLQRNGIEVIKPKEEKISSDTITFEMTGSPPNSGDLKTKSDYIALFTKYNHVHKSLGKDTKVLITDSYSSPSSKMGKATKLGVEILTYEDFITKYCK